MAANRMIKAFAKLKSRLDCLLFKHNFKRGKGILYHGLIKLTCNHCGKTRFTECLYHLKESKR